MSSKQCDKNHKCHNVSSRNSKVNYTHKNQEHCTDHNCNYRSLSDCSSDISEKHRQCIHCFSCFQLCQRSRPRHSVVNKISHLTCKTDQQKTTCSQCRVHEVLSESSKQLFHNNDGKYCTKHTHPPRECRRKIQCEQKSCYNCTEIIDRNRLMH